MAVSLSGKDIIMEIQSSGNKITIKGNIKSIDHYHAISKEIDMFSKEANNIHIHLLDSISITSSVVGYLCRLVSKSDISLSIFVKDDNLHSLFDELKLIQLLNVRKI